MKPGCFLSTVSEIGIYKINCLTIAYKNVKASYYHLVVLY
jgi:hypothetical protein